MDDRQRLEAIISVVCKYLPPDGIPIKDAMSEIIGLVDPLPPQPVQEPVGYEHHEYRPFGAPGEIRIHAILKSQFLLPDGSITGDFQWLADQYSIGKNTIKLEPLYTTPPQRERVVFPTMLRKMWSGGEVQAWLDENVNKEKNA